WMEHITNHGTGWVRMDYLVPARGLIGFRTEFLTETRGTGIMHHVFDRWEPWAGELLTRSTGALVADRRGATATYSLMTLQERGALFVGPGEEVYEGMIVGENSRSEDLDVNPCKEKHLTNMRSSTAEVLVRLDAHHKQTRDEALELVREDEAVEATPVYEKESEAAWEQQLAAGQIRRATINKLLKTVRTTLKDGRYVLFRYKGEGSRVRAQLAAKHVHVTVLTHSQAVSEAKKKP